MKLLIADDDFNTVERIRSALDYKNCGVTEILTELNGTAAYETIKQERPEIILSDIEMPGMDGLELLHKVSALYETMPEFIFLTCHSDFRYAQQAIRYGVRDYLTKPFEQDELVAVVSMAVVEAGKKVDSSLLRKAGERYRNSQEYLRNTFFQQLFNKTVTGDAARLSQYAKEKGIPFDPEEVFYCCALEAVASQHSVGDSVGDCLFPVRNISAEVMFDSIDYTHVLTVSSEDRIRILLLLSRGRFTKEDIRERCYRLTEMLKKYLGMFALCLVSQESRPDQFADVGDTLWAAVRKYVAMDSRVMFLEEIPVLEGTQNYVPSLGAGQLMGYLQEKQKVALILCIRNEIQRAERDKKLTAEYMKRLHHEIIQAFYGFLAESHVQASALFNNSVYESLLATAQNSPIQMIKYLDYIYDLTMRQIEEVRESQSIIEKTKAYIDEHFREDIGRDSIAEFVCVSPNYLSKVWRRETGSMLREYINECRIREAKRLMGITNYNGKEIAMRVGFGNTTYFSSTFKRYTGLTPSEWKQQNVKS